MADTPKDAVRAKTPRIKDDPNEIKIEPWWGIADPEVREGPSDALFPKRTKEEIVRAKRLEKTKQLQKETSRKKGRWVVEAGNTIGQMSKVWKVPASKIIAFNKVDPRKLRIGSTILKPK